MAGGRDRDDREKRRRHPAESLLRHPPSNPNKGLSDLRYLVLTQGLAADDAGDCSYRPYIWSLFLAVSPVQTDRYLALVHRGPSPAYSKVRNDTFRTLATDMLFRRKVSETSLIRLLNAVAWSRHDALQNQGRRDTSAVSAVSDAELYVQGMNVLAAPFLYACASETQAFAFLTSLLGTRCPLYVSLPRLEGVHSGLRILDGCLALIDPKLHAHLLARGLKAEVYAFASVLTLSACTPPLAEVLVLWDFLLAFGVHMNILAVVAQLLLMRDALMAATSPVALLRTFPVLQARKVVTLAVSFVRVLPEDLFDVLVRHPYDPAVPAVLDRLGL
ncbi:rab-GTPase-TBC domain-containing protein [Dipodascopsis tothii]|uniref:rab-GTPase-TBC domain-containing protein n=1 Tax=Dipodascopsis tothii TaxID=44089 RepID=UPI0034CE5F28